MTLNYSVAERPAALDFTRGRLSYTWSPTTGRIAGISAPSGINLTYAQDGSLPTRTTWSGPVAGSVERTYDSTFRVVSEQVNGEAPVTYQYDADGLLTQAGNLTITRSPQTGLVTGTTLGVVTTANVYNTFGELTRQEAKSQGVPVLAIDYTRDRLGRITRKVETIEGVTATWDYGYDPAGRLQEVYRDGTRLSRYEYDANGNRLTHVTPAETITATYDAQDRLLTYGDLTYTYTANGELATKTQNGQTEQYDYDELGNLVKVTRPDGLVIEYLIDGQGRRVGKKVGGTLVKGWLYKDQLEPVAELNGTTLASRFLYATRPNTPDVLLQGGQTYRVLSDHLGSPRLILPATGGVALQRLDFDEFGQATLNTNPDAQPFGFAGGLADRHTGLVRFGARDYDARAGRWGAKDPILFGGGDSNLYGYVFSEPVNQIDVDGLSVRNDCDCTIYYKTEDAGDANPLEAGKTYPGEIDGVAHPDRPGRVFKVTKGNDAVVRNGGIITTVPQNVFYDAGQAALGGWKGVSFLIDRHDRDEEDHGWDALFNSVIPRLPGSPVSDPQAACHRWSGIGQ